MTVTIRRVVTPDELDEVYRFRYAVYVEEMSRVESYACHNSKRLMDSLDHPEACVFAAWSDGKIVGTVRVNLAKGGG